MKKLIQKFNKKWKQRNDYKKGNWQLGIHSHDEDFSIIDCKKGELF